MKEGMQQLIDAMRQGIAITLQTTIHKLGPIPNRHGDMVRSIMSEDDSAKIMSLGCHLEDCMKDKSYGSLDFLADSIAKKEKQESKS